MQKNNSAIATNVINRLAVEDPMAAQQFYAKNAGYMTPEDQMQIQKVLGSSVRKQLAYQAGDALYATGTLGAESLPALIVQAESGGDAAAVSPKGALGLMQLMPDTAKEMAAEMGVPYDEARLLADPQYNMALGTAYIEKMRNRYQGSNALAVAAYNAGPGRVRTLGRIPPFRETIDYVAAITKGWSSGAYRAASVQTAAMPSAAGWRGRGVQLLAYTSTSVPNPR